jgi:hypothetical protein
MGPRALPNSRYSVRTLRLSLLRRSAWKYCTQVALAMRPTNITRTTVASRRSGVFIAPPA